MKLFVITFTALVMLTGAANVHAQADIMIKQKARALPNQPQPANPQPPPPGTTQKPATPTPAPTPPPAGPALTTQQLQLIDKLALELAGIKAGSTATAEQKKSVEDAATALGSGAAKASKDSMTKLSADLCGAMASKEVISFDRGQLAKAVNVVLNSGSMTPQQTASAITIAQNTMKSANVPDADVKTVVADLRSISAELQKSRPALYR